MWWGTQLATSECRLLRLAGLTFICPSTHAQPHCFPRVSVTSTHISAGAPQPCQQWARSQMLPWCQPLTWSSADSPNQGLLMDYGWTYKLVMGSLPGSPIWEESSRTSQLWKI